MANKKLFPNQTAVTIKAAAPKKKPAKPAAEPAAEPEKPAKAKPGPLSMTAAAEKILAEEGKPMTCHDLIARMAERGYWKSPHGLTPHNTLYAAILRLIQRDGKDCRFRKAGRGQFEVTDT